MATPTVTVTIRLPPDLYEGLRGYVERRELNTFMVEAAREKLEREKKRK